eukprot:CAMPEP_0184864418 /NCGR_PEP_ID=MMETSP0580-20130426/14866_1 /TAXON_ID=1118495 /ORGANISM="Dactyliosolen fragilissimus" /LENGTH=939 /DNA_ID=CAMNT_0027363195 /DNA_START=41 /DNA_END=2860 /DNA_ORIENTATION=-
MVVQTRRRQGNRANKSETHDTKDTIDKDIDKKYASSSSSDDSESSDVEKTQNRSGTENCYENDDHTNVEEQDDDSDHRGQEMNDDSNDDDDAKVDTTIESLESLYDLFSHPENLLHTMLLPPHPKVNDSKQADDDGWEEDTKERINQIGLLHSASRVLFSRLERIAALKEHLSSRSKNKREVMNDENGEHKEEEVFGIDEDEAMNEVDDPYPLSGLPALYTGERNNNHELNNVNGEGEFVDAETIWGQIDIQNTSLLKILSKSIKGLNRKLDKGGQENVLRLMNMGDIHSDHESDGEDLMENSEESDEESEVEDDLDNEETRKIRERMERSMKDMDATVNQDIEEEEEEENSRSLTTDKDVEDNQEVDDPAADELNDGFFDINEMEAWADEEDEMIPEDDDLIQGLTKHKNKSNKQKLHHLRSRMGDSDSDDDVSENDFNSDQDDDEPRIKRRTYRDDEDIKALASLYKEDDDFDDDDEIATMTAADFFGKPNPKWLKNKKSNKSDKTHMNKMRENKITKAEGNEIVTLSKETNIDSGKDDDSWDNHDFGEDADGWREQNNPDSEEEDNVERKIEGNENNVKNDESKDDDKDQVTEYTSKHSIKSNKLLKHTEQLEAELLAEKPWQMVGEAQGKQRPTDSLLDATPEFELATKMVPIITVDHTVSIEDMIKQRVIDEDWDDVVPRELPDIGAKDLNGELPEVSQEKSKLGLGELYEREYLKKVAKYDKNAKEKQSEEEKAKSEMKALFANLCSKLDALSNYHFAPRPVAEEAEVKTMSMPAIAMEEVLPLHVSDSRALAPEEIYGAKKGRDAIIRGETEMDQTDRKRLRQAKKAARRKARKAQLADEKLISRLQPGLGLNNPYEKRKLREELQMARASGKVVRGEVSADSDYKTSTKFFERLQQDVETTIQGDNGNDDILKKRKRGDMESINSSSKLKL